jgi:hypothetical protein
MSGCIVDTGPKKKKNCETLKPRDRTVVIAVGTLVGSLPVPHALDVFTLKDSSLFAGQFIRIRLWIYKWSKKDAVPKN